MDVFMVFLALFDCTNKMAMTATPMTSYWIKASSYIKDTPTTVGSMKSHFSTDVDGNSILR